MNKLDKGLLERIEKALNLHFMEWQINYMLDIPMILDMRITGRATGKTLVYIIKLLFASDKPIRAYDLEEMANYSDWYCITHDPSRKVPHYTKWFREELVNIYKILIENDIHPRCVLLKKDEERTEKEKDYEKINNKSTFLYHSHSHGVDSPRD
jgi:hypothetical protein